MGEKERASYGSVTTLPKNYVFDLVGDSYNLYKYKCCCFSKTNSNICCRFARNLCKRLGEKLMARIKTDLKISLSNDDKEYIKKKSDELGFKTVSAFLIESAKSHFRLNLDMSVYRNLAREINYIGKNINSLIRRINTDGIYSDSDIDFLKTNQKIIIDLLNKEYDRLLNLKKNFNSENLSLNDKENLIKALQQNQLEVPKKVVLEEVYEQIKDDFIYIVNAIEKSPKQDKDIEDYVWEYLYGDTTFSLDDERLIEFANDIFIYTQKLKMKLAKLDNIFDDDDWFSFKEILDEYEVY